MKNSALLLLMATVVLSVSCFGQNTGKPDPFQKANNTVNKVSTVIAVFQPYLLKARQLFYDARQLTGDVRNAAKNSFGKTGHIDNTGIAGGTQPTAYPGQAGYPDTLHSNSQAAYDAGSYPNTGSYNSSSNNSTANTGYTNANSNNPQGSYPSGGAGQNVQTYLPGQGLPINNTASVNNDGTGNWGNQNNGLYGNCLDALTGTVLGMGEAAQKPAAVDLLFFAPADGQNTYYIMTPGFARNNSTASYMTQHTSDQVMQWSDVNESEVALTKITIGQFEQIQNNNQILNVVRNAQNYAGFYQADQKLDGQVFAVKAQMDTREVYALVAVIKQIGTSGSNGYLKIKIKSSGIDNNHDGQVDANAYMR